MKLSTTAAFTAILLAQSASAWTFTWRNSAGTAHVVDGGNGNKGCTKISHGKEQVFNWDRSLFSSCCISLYWNNACNGDPQGYSCNDWTKASSTALASFKVTKC